MGNLTQGGGASASPEPVVIFEGDISAQTAAHSVLTLEFDLPTTGVLEFVGDTASLDSNPVLDTPGIDLVPLGTIRCSDLQGLPGITEAQAQLVNWVSYRKVYLENTTILDSAPQEESAIQSPPGFRRAGLFVCPITSSLRKLACKLGFVNGSSIWTIDFAPLIIRWIP